MINPDRLITVPHAADQAEVTRSAIFRAIADGRLEAVTVDGVKFVLRDSLAQYKTGGNRGRKRKNAS